MGEGEQAGFGFGEDAAGDEAFEFGAQASVFFAAVPVPSATQMSFARNGSPVAANTASAVEEQTATTSEMSRSVNEAATGSGDIAATISDVTRAAQAAAVRVDEAQRATADLARMGTELSALVGNYRV